MVPVLSLLEIMYGKHEMKKKTGYGMAFPFASIDENFASSDLSMDAW